MRLFSSFFHKGPADVPKPDPTESPRSRDFWLRIGRLEADVASLVMQWAAYRDELRRLVNRLEKRDQRAEARETRAAEPDVEIDTDETTARVLARRHALRGRNGLSGQQEG